MKKIDLKNFIIALIFSSAMFAQEKPFVANAFIQAGGASTSERSIVFINYRIPYNSIVFIKDAEGFSARFSVNIEARDSLNENLIYRARGGGKILELNYDQTLSKKNYAQGSIQIEVPPSTYRINSVLEDLNSSNQIFLGATTVRFHNSEIKNSFVIYSDQKFNGKDSIFKLLNFGDIVPYSSESYGLLLLSDSTVNKVEVEILDREEILYKREAVKLYNGGFDLITDDSGVYLVNSEPYGYFNYFLIDDLFCKLKEGDYILNVKIPGNENFTFKRNISIVWLNKPVSLLNDNIAVELLKYIASDEEIANIKRKPKSQRREAVIDYWKSKDPTEKTHFNEIMEEYYNRADYAFKNFSALGKYDGAFSDRGRIYILYGAPDNVDRIYSDNKRTLEVWGYEKSKLEFIFEDSAGAGVFRLKENK